MEFNATMKLITELKVEINEDDDLITKMICQLKHLTGNMKAATGKQRNVSSVIKDGLEEMKEALDRLKEERGIRKKAVGRLISALCAQAPGAREIADFSTPEVGSKKSKRLHGTREWCLTRCL